MLRSMAFDAESQLFQWSILTGCLANVKYVVSTLGFNAQVVDYYGFTPLHYACRKGHLDITKYLISDCNCNPHCSANNGDTPLHCACQNGHRETAKYLITEHKCNPEFCGVDGYTPLHSAAHNGHLAVVKYLISERGCYPQIADNGGFTPLHYACYSGHLDITKYLISDCNCNSQCTDVNGNTPLHSACVNGHLEVVKYLIHKCSRECGNVSGYAFIHGHLIIVKCLIRGLGYNPLTAWNTRLHYACLNENLAFLGCNPQCINNDGYTPLHYACLTGRLDLTKYLISDCNCNPQCSTNIGYTPLHCACTNGHLEVAKHLIIEHKCNLEPSNDDGYTPLYLAARNDHLAVVKYLISELGCNPQIADNDGLSPLHCVCLNGHLDTTKYLISDCNCNPQCSTKSGDTPLHCACQNGHLEVAKYLTTKHKCSPEHGNVTGITPLHLAATNGQLAVVKYLISELGFNPQIASNDGNTLLHGACVNGHLEISKYLISECNCNPQCSAKDGFTPLHCACENGHLEVAKHLIIEHKCNPEPSNDDGYTPLHSTASNGHLTVVKYLISELGCNPQIVDNNGLTPLHYACLNGHLDITRYLISDRNCNPHCSTKSGDTPLHYACQNGHLEVAKYFISEHKCSPEHGNVTGITALYLAATNGHLAVVKYLISELSCNPHIVSNDGYTLLHGACLKGHLEISKYLISDCNCNPQRSAKDGFTPLQCTCQNGHLEVAKYLITEHKCSPEHSNVTALHLVATNGHLALVKYLISELGCNPYIASNDGYTLLHGACLKGHLEISKYLISECNCNPQCSAKDGFTPLHCACENGHLEVAKYLITEHKCSPEHGNVDGYTPLHSAARNGHLAVMKYLISELGCNPQIAGSNGNTPLHYACLNGHLNITNYLTSDCNCNPECIANRGYVPLHDACLNGHLEVVKYLITEHKCSPERGDVTGSTPLHLAAHNGHLAVVKYLINELRCNPQCRNFIGMTPLGIACFNGHLHIVKCLVQEQKCPCELELNVPEAFKKEKLGLSYILHTFFQTLEPALLNDGGVTLLHLACAEGHLDIVKYLIEVCKCNPNHPISNGLTAIDFAQMRGHQGIVSYLRIEHQSSKRLDQVYSMISRLYGVNLNDAYISPLHWACSYGDLEAVRLCITKPNCNPSSTDFLGRTPLHIACMNGHLKIAKYLVMECKCDLNCALSIRTLYHENITPLVLATAFGQLQVVRWLVSELKCNQECSENSVPWSLDRLACTYGHLNVLKYWLLERSTQDLPGLLVTACLFGHLDIIKYLIDEHNCDPYFTDHVGASPLHIACRGIQFLLQRYLEDIHTTSTTSSHILLYIRLIIIFVSISILKYFQTVPNSMNEIYMSDASWADNEKKSTKQQPTNPYLDIVKYLINEHKYNPQCTDKEGLTPFHYACAGGQLKIVQFFYSEKLCDLVHTAHSGDTPLHFACKYNQVAVTRFLLSTGECDPLIKNTEGLTPVEITTSPEIMEQLDHFCKGKYPLESVVKVFVVGDPSAGKSSLVQAIQSNPGFLSSLIGRFQKVKEVRQQTVGINSFSFNSSEFGNVVIYDFAGQREFYTSHAAFLQNSSSYIPGIFILVANIALCEDDIHQSLQYWISFIQECCVHMHSDTKPYIICVGSHADQLHKTDVEAGFTLFQKCVFEHSDKFYEVEGVMCLDCTRPSSPELDLLRYHLEESCNSIREKTEKIDQRCYVLHKYVLKEYIDMGIHGRMLKNISKDLEENPYLLPSNSTELLPLFQTLHDRGQVILLKNKHILGKSWVITNIAALLETVVGSTFAPRDFPQHIAPGSTGIVLKSKITAAFPDIDIDMIIGFLEHFEFCHQVGLDWIIQSKHEVSDTNDEHYLFPAFLTLENIPQVLHESHESHYCCGWFMHSTVKHQFFTIRLLHVLLLRLAFLFALPQDIAIPTVSEDETPALKRSCTMWKSGITWHDTNGVSTHFEVRELKTVILIMSSMKGSEIHCVRLRTQLIKTILKARKEFCQRVDVEECIMEVESEGLVHTVQKCPSQCSKYSLKYLCDMIATRDASDHQDLVLVNPDGSPGKRISELLYFEPYTLLTADLIAQMFSRHSSSLIVSDAFLSEVAARFYLCKNILSQILMPQPRLLNEKLKMDVYSLDSLDDMSKHFKCVHILEAWMGQQESPATYRKLRQELDKYSIFCGRNPLDVVGDKEKDIDSDSLQQQLYSSDESDDSSEDERGDDNAENSSPCDDKAEQPTLIECVRFRGRKRRINIAQEIGIKYHDFGLFLLEDDTGARIQSLAHKHMNDAEQINMEVLRHWITGRGRHPVSWKTLTQVLHDIDLRTLAGEIEVVKCHTGIPTEPSEDPAPKGLQDIPAEKSEQRSTEHTPPGVPEDEKPCKTSEELRVDIDLLAADPLDRYHEKKENRKKSTSHGFGGDSSQSLRNKTAEVSKESDQGSSGDTPACGIQADKAIHEITDIASELPSKCSDLFEAFEQTDKRSSLHRVSDSPQKSRRDTTAVVTVGSEQGDIPESDFQHNLQQIVDVAADLLSKCFKLEAFNLERDDQRSNEGIEDRVDATAYLLNRYFEAGLVSCEASNQALNSEKEESQRHSATSDDPSGLNDMTAEGSEQRNADIFACECALKQIAHIAADLLSRCFEPLDFDASNKESERNSVSEDLRGLATEMVKVSEQGGIRNEPTSCTDSNEDAECYEALQHIADIAADLLYRCFALLDFLALCRRNRTMFPIQLGTDDSPPR